MSGELERPAALDPRSGVDESGEWTPAFPGQRPPFRPTHGVFSKMTLEPRAAEIASEIRAVLDEELGAATSRLDDTMVGLLATTLAQIEACVADFAQRGLIRPDGSASPLVKHIGTMLNTAGRFAAQLGMSPTSRAALGLDIVRTGDELERYLAQRRQSSPAEGSS